MPWKYADLYYIAQMESLTPQIISITIIVNHLIKADCEAKKWGIRVKLLEIYHIFFFIIGKLILDNVNLLEINHIFFLLHNC